MATRPAFPPTPPASAIEAAFNNVSRDTPPELEGQLAPGQTHPVAKVSGDTCFYRVPLDAAGRVRGFMDLDDQGALLRYGFRPSQPGGAGLPQDLLEMTPKDIADQARRVDPSAAAEDFHLVTLDGGAQLAWAAPVGDNNLYVTPGTAWLAPPSSNGGEGE